MNKFELELLREKRYLEERLKLVNKELKKSTEHGANGTMNYTIKQGSNAGKVVKSAKDMQYTDENGAKYDV